MPIPPWTKDTIDRYVETRVLNCGSFVEAVLKNDLQQAVAHADDQNEKNLGDIVRYLYNHCPMDCWGSPEKVKAWATKA